MFHRDALLFDDGRNCSTGMNRIESFSVLYSIPLFALLCAGHSLHSAYQVPSRKREGRRRPFHPDILLQVIVPTTNESIIRLWRGVDNLDQWITALFKFWLYALFVYLIYRIRHGS